ncbi:MAG: HEAT repeat domain-containing protein [Nitrosopumilus sp.]|nr:HEAT repeat domain-containing protein [Nitrosopumilus sp.]
MSRLALDENEIRRLSLEDRVTELEHIFKNSDDESARWDAVWLAGEIPVEVGLKGPLFDRVADLYAWVLKNDDNAVVRHEVCYQIAGRNMREKIPNLVESGLYDKSELVRHEAIECLGIIRAFDQIGVMKKALDDPNEYVRETARMVLKRMERLKEKEFKPEAEFVSY